MNGISIHLLGWVLWFLFLFIFVCSGGSSTWSVFVKDNQKILLTVDHREDNSEGSIDIMD